MTVLQKEKLIVIKKELLHLYHIADFYKAKFNTHDEEKTQREKISEKIYNDINGYFSYIEKLNKQLDIYYLNFGKREKEYISFLTLYDFYNKEIRDLLKMVQIIKSKFLQFQQEHYNQYMPVPNVNKRYSSKGFLDYLKDYHTKILYSADPHIGHPISLWGYTDSFRAHTSLGKHGENEEKYIEIPFWNYEIPFMLPFITHEMGHIILDYDKEKNDKTLFSKLRKAFYKHANTTTNNIFSKNIGLLDEILADIIALIYHGEAYIIAASHELLGIGFAEQFYSKNPKDPVAIGKIDLDNKKFIEGLIRLSILTILSSKNTTPELLIYMQELQKIFAWIIVDIEAENYEINIHSALYAIKEKNLNCLAQYFSVFYNLTSEYIEFHYEVTAYANKIEEIINSDEVSSILADIIKVKNRFKKLTSYRNVFNSLADTRLKKLSVEFQDSSIDFKNKFRKLILEKDKVLGEGEDIGSAYELTMFKTRMDRSSTGEEGEYTEVLTKEIKTSYNSILINKCIADNSTARIYQEKHQIEPKFTFDDYHMLALIKKRECITIRELNIFLEHTSSEEKETPKYYTNKYSLILLHKKDTGTKEGNFSAFINLSLKRNDSENTLKAKKELIEIIQEESELQQTNYEIYKSLGPKEIVVHIRDTTLQTVYNAKEKLFQNRHNIFHRSHTIIYCDHTQADSIIISNPFHCGTLLRAKTGKEHRDFENSNIRASLMTTGVKDYTIQWNEDIKLNEIISYCSKLSSNGMCTDVQTFVAKKLDSQ